MALPTFFIIGAAKAGTTSLHYYLDQHPEVQMSATKEPHFFSGPENGVPYAMQRVSRLEDYERLFDPAFGVRGEASPSYSESPRRPGVPERIKERVPNAKLVYLVRDPVARTVSHYQHSVASGNQRRPLEEALEDLSDHSYLICQSLYARQLELYLSQFPQESVLVVDQAELLANRDATLRQVFSFLEVDRDFTSPDFDRELWTTHDRRASPPGHDRFIKRFVAPAAEWIPADFKQGIRRSFERAFWPPLPPAKLDSESRSKLEDRFAGDVERLRALTGQAFPTWSV